MKEGLPWVRFLEQVPYLQRISKSSWRADTGPGIVMLLKSSSRLSPSPSWLSTPDYPNSLSGDLSASSLSLQGILHFLAREIFLLLMSTFVTLPSLKFSNGSHHLPIRSQRCMGSAAFGDLALILLPTLPCPTHDASPPSHTHILSCLADRYHSHRELQRPYGSRGGIAKILFQY